MPLLSRNKSLPGSAASQTTAAAANSKQQQPLVCESPLFGLRRQLPVSCGMSSPEETVGSARQSHSNQRQTVSAKNSSSTSTSSSSSLTSALKSRYTDLCSASSSSASTSSSTNANTTTKTAAAAPADTMVSIPKQITRQQIHYAFSIMDTNSDGLIDVRDLSQTLANLGVPIDEAILSHVMSTVSKRGDHLISEQEFLRWIGNFIQVSDLTEAGPAATAQQLTGSGKRSAARGNGASGSIGTVRSGQARTHSAVARSSSTTSPSNSSSSPSSSSSLLAQSIEAQQLIGQQMRQRRGSGSGLALMRSLSSQSSSPSTSTSATATAVANNQQRNLSKADSNQRDTTAALSANNQQQQQAELQQEARDDLKAAFCVFDLDGDGYITIDEVQQGLKLLGESWSQAELNQLLFSKCDPNNNSSTGASGIIKSGKTLGKRMDLSMAKQPQQQQRISIEDFVKLLL